MSFKKKLGTLVLAVGLAGFSLGTAASGNAAAAELGTTTPVGVWIGTVRISTSTGDVTLSFDQRGKVCLKSKSKSKSKSRDGSNSSSEGSGIWRPAGENRFTYQVRERLFAGDGSTVGWVKVNQKAVQDDDTFRSSGISRVYDANGAFVGTTESKVTASRVSRSPTQC